MTLLLSSVTDLDEAKIVARASDIIELKNTQDGELDWLAIHTITSEIKYCQLRVILSPSELSRLAKRLFDFAGMGICEVAFPVNEAFLEQAKGFLTQAQAELRWIGILAAERKESREMLPALAELGFAGAMLDTFDKSGPRLTQQVDSPSLDEFCRNCRDLKLQSNLAGGLEAPDLARLLAINPDVLGFRSALCFEGRRDRRIDPQAVGQLRELIPRKVTSVPVVKAAAEPFDCIYVRNIEVLSYIGAYSFERSAPQRVAFDVDAYVRRDNYQDDVRSTFSYDLIIDAIQRIGARGHTTLVETYAEELANLILVHSNVDHVRIKVEKLDVAPGGSVGIEIYRRRFAGN